MKTRFFAILCALLLSIVLIGCLWSGPAQAIVFYDDSFEAASLGGGGWGWNSGYCASSPCPYLDLSTDVTHQGSKSLKGTYSAAWSDPHPQINTQGINRNHPATTDLYTRYYYRTNGFTYSAAAGTKHIYFKGSGGTGYPNGFSINWFGSREIGFAIQGAAEGVGNASFYPNMASKPLADNTWYCIEEHYKLGTPGQADGMVEIWVDGTQTVGYYNRSFLPSGVSGPNGSSSLAAFDTLEIYKQNGDGLMYYDQFAAGNTRIGCSGSAPANDTTPPASPVGLSIR